MSKTPSTWYEHKERTTGTCHHVICKSPLQIPTIISYPEVFLNLCIISYEISTYYNSLPISYFILTLRCQNEIDRVYNASGGAVEPAFKIMAAYTDTHAGTRLSFFLFSIFEDTSVVVENNLATHGLSCSWPQSIWEVPRLFSTPSSTYSALTLSIYI